MRRAFYLYLSLAAAVSLALFACVQDYVDPHNPATAPGRRGVESGQTGILAVTRMGIYIADIFVGVYLLWGAVNAVAVAHGHYDPILLWKWAAIGAVYALLRMCAAKRVAKKVILWTFVAAGVVQAVIAALQLAGLVRSNHSMFDVTGSFGNPGQLGGVLSVAFVVSAALFFNYWRSGDNIKNRAAETSRWVALVSSLIITAGLIMADSRASWVAAAAGAAVYFRKPLGQWLRRWWVIALPSAIVVLLVGGAALYCYRPASADARLLVWRVSADMIADKPLLGHGVGSFTQEYMLYQARYFEAHPDSRFAAVADNAAYPYNELLHVLIEQGIVGALILIALFTTIFAHRPRDGVQSCVQAGLAALIAFSMFSYPADKFALLVLFAVFAGLAESRGIFVLQVRWEVKWVAATGLIAICILAAHEYVFYHTAQQNAKALFRKDNAGALAFIETNYDRLKYSRQFNRTYAAWLAEHPDINRMLVLPPSCETWCDIGNAYAATGDFAAAEHYYTIAARMIPTRLTPNYLLWKMEVQRSDTLRAVEIGEALLVQPLKVESTYTLRAKAEAREFLKLMEATDPTNP